MKKILIALAVLAFAGSAYAAQKTDATVKDVRNPQKLTAIINANAADAESRLTSGSTTAADLALIGASDTTTASVTMQSDAPLGVADDAGDKYGIVATDGSGLEIQSDVSSKGTLATVASIENTGLITSLVGIDAIGAVDFDIGSADVTDVTVTTDGGAVVLDGSVTAADDLVSTDDCTVGDDLAVTGLATVGETLAVTGVATFTAESVHNGGIDADYITVDAAAGIDTKSAGTLKVGESTATKVEVADTGVETEVQGALDCLSTLAVASTAAFAGNATIGANADMLAIVDAGTSTNTLMSNGLLDGEYVADDTIDDDSIDFSDVTFADFSGNIAVASITNAAGSVGASIGGNIPVASVTNAFVVTLQPAYAAGVFSIASTTQLVFIASGVTNVIDSDITTH